jgi:5-methyltetrahydropteroyltriglutamate--homocysteine methyltransferase
VSEHPEGAGAGGKAPPRLIPATVVGSYSVPAWLERLKTDYHRGRLSAERLEEVHDVVIKAAVKDQELVGIDIISDGELRRDNEVDYLVARLDGVEILEPKSYYYDYYRAVVRRPLPEPSGGPGFGLVDQFRFVDALSDRPVTVSLVGPFSLSRRLVNEAYGSEKDFVLALARALHAEAAALAAAGARYLQIDEPFLAGYPEAAELAVAAINTVTAGVDAHWAAHVCYGNRYARPAWEGHYDFLFPAFLEARVDELKLEFARKGYEDLELFQRFPSGLQVGVGVVDVKNPQVEPADIIEARIRQAVKLVGPDRVAVNPDCGLRNLPPAAARAKLAAMTTAVGAVRADVLGVQRPDAEPS